MEVLTQNATRRSTRIRVQIPVSVTSLDRMRPFADKCMALIVSAQGCGFQTSQAMLPETPILLSNLPGGGSVTARVVNCTPLGNDGKQFLIGASLYTHGNVWGITNPPDDWNLAALNYPVTAPVTAPATAPVTGSVTGSAKAAAASAPTVTVNKKSWPYNLAAEGDQAHPRRK
ncbi:MAG: hypothetical protein ABSF93_17820 [Candidatus Sulfotelmatobacter sp.]